MPRWERSLHFQLLEQSLVCFLAILPLRRNPLDCLPRSFPYQSGRTSSILNLRWSSSLGTLNCE